MTHRIGIDARLFGTAQAAGVGQYTEELVEHIVKEDTDNQYQVFLAPEVVNDFSVYAPNLTRVEARYPHYSYSEQFLYPAFLRRKDLDLVHYTNFNAPIFGVGIPNVVTVHDLTLWFFAGRKQKSAFRRWGYRLAIRRACENADHIIAISEVTKNDIVRLLKIDPHKITVIYEAVADRYKPVKNDSRLIDLKRKFGISKPYLLYVGQWREHKNVVRLIRAFASLRRQHNCDYQLVIVGKIDPVYPEVPATIKELGLDEDVVLAGYVPDADLPHFYSGAELFVFPSLYEGFGLPPLEAMACGAPVVSSNSSCLPEVLGNAAHFFDPLDVAAMSRAMADVVKSYTLKRDLRLKGLKRVRRYSFAKMARETLAIYHQVLGVNHSDEAV